MNCCTNNCTQGRNCPARVAKVGQRHLAAEPLPPTRHGYLKDLARALFAVVAVMFTTALLVPFFR